MISEKAFYTGEFIFSTETMLRSITLNAHVDTRPEKNWGVAPFTDGGDWD